MLAMEECFGTAHSKVWEGNDFASGAACLVFDAKANMRKVEYDKVKELWYLTLLSFAGLLHVHHSISELACTSYTSSRSAEVACLQAPLDVCCIYTVQH